MRTRVCFYCKKSEKQDDIALMQCSACKEASYCSKECQTKGWKTHKAMCRQTREMKKRIAAADIKRECRLLSQWMGVAPLLDLLASHYGVAQLRDMQDKAVVVLVVMFDYNKRTFVPILTPNSVPRNLYEQKCPGGASLFEGSGSNEEDAIAVKCICWTTHTAWDAPRAVSGGMVPLSTLSESILHNATWDEIVKHYFRKNAYDLTSSIFEAWEPKKQENIFEQLELVENSPNWFPFVINALRVTTTQPLHQTHIVVVDLNMAMGLGQIAKLVDYHVVPVQEAKKQLQEKYTPKQFELWRPHLELKDHPDLLEERKRDPNAARLLVLFISTSSANLIPLFIGIASYPDELKSSLADCNAKARGHFTALTNISFPAIKPLDLH